MSLISPDFSQTLRLFFLLMDHSCQQKTDANTAFYRLSYSNVFLSSYRSFLQTKKTLVGKVKLGIFGSTPAKFKSMPHFFERSFDGPL